MKTQLIILAIATAFAPFAQGQTPKNPQPPGTKVPADPPAKVPRAADPAGQMVIELDAVAEPDLIAQVAAFRGYSPTVVDADGNQVPNPQSAKDFVRAILVDYLQNIATAAEVQKAGTAAAEAARAKRDRVK